MDGLHCLYLKHVLQNVDQTCFNFCVMCNNSEWDSE